MGIFDFLFEKKKKLLRWQNFLLNTGSSKLTLTEQQLKSMTIANFENNLRIIKESSSILDKTVKPDVFFSRLDLIMKKSEYLCQLEEFMKVTNIPMKETYNTVKISVKNQ